MSKELLTHVYREVGSQFPKLFEYQGFTSKTAEVT